MSTLRFSLSANFGSQASLDQWDRNWTYGMTSYQFGAAAVAASAVTLAPAADRRDDITFIGSGTAGFGKSTPVVRVHSTTAGGVTRQDIALNATWNTVKNIAVTNVETDVLTVAGFVDTVIQAADRAAHSIEVDGAKRGQVTLGDGNDNLTVNYASNERTWSNVFAITAGNGNDTITVRPESFAAIAAMSTPTGWVFNQSPQTTNALIAVGDGNDTINLAASGSIWVGAGTDTIRLSDGVHIVHLGAGSDTVTIAAHDLSQPATAAFSTQRDVNSITFGTGRATVSIDDGTGSRTPLTSLHIARGHAGGGTEATADVLRYGHTDATTGAFTGGDWSALSLDLTGYSAGSTATLARSGDHTLLRLQDGATGGVDLLALYGGPVADMSALHLHFR